MTTAETMNMIGALVKLPIDGFEIPSIVKDIRTVWGRTDALVTPENGDGEMWVNIDRLKPAHIRSTD